MHEMKNANFLYLKWLDIFRIVCWIFISNSRFTHRQSSITFDCSESSSALFVEGLPTMNRLWYYWFLAICGNKKTQISDKKNQLFQNNVKIWTSISAFKLIKNKTRLQLTDQNIKIFCYSEELILFQTLKFRQNQKFRERKYCSSCFYIKLVD